jgi:glutathionyl-hydroquinone reductase
MGSLIDGKWHEGWYDTSSTGGQFVRPPSSFRNWVTPDGSPGPTGRGGFKSEAGRYHLYVSYACPWAHRTMIMRALKGLEQMITLSVVNPVITEGGWNFHEYSGVVSDPTMGAEFLHQIYTAAFPAYTGTVTVPVLWDKDTATIVNNESAEIIRMLNAAFDHLGARDGDYYPSSLRGEIGSLNNRIYETVNNGVYKAGFSTSQEAYESAVTAVFDTMDRLDQRLSDHRYLFGSVFSEADIRLATTLFRFDSVYHGHFKCNLRRLTDYPNLWPYARELFQMPLITPTIHFDHIKHHYYRSHTRINPTRIVPLGPELTWHAPHDRGAISARRA